jgi:1-acyl-sn-glycerol-3-phosphate acyltransferase
MSLVFFGPLLIARLFSRSDMPGHWVAVMWCGVVATFTGITTSLHGGEKIDPKQSYIITPNHQGNADILALRNTLPLKYLWVIKQSLVRIPFFGWGLAATGAIALDRSKKSEALARLQGSAGSLGDGWSILTYPEGTRTPDGQLLPFKKGAFMLAVQTGIPILPITINGAHKLFPKNSIAIKAGHITVTVSDPIPTRGLTEDDVPELMRKTREAVEQHLDPDYDPFTKR